MNKRTLNGQFTDIYNAFAGIIFRFCILRVSNREQALDITQETFTRFWNELCHGKKILNPKAFLFTVAHRQVIDWYRKKKSVSLDGLADEETGEPYEPRNELARQDIEMSAEGRFVLDSIGKLDLSYRQVVFLRFVDGLPPSEIGEILGLTPNVVSVRINRGVEQLRKITGYDVDESFGDDNISKT